MPDFSILLGGQETARFSELQGVRSPADAVAFPNQPMNGTLTFRRSSTGNPKISAWHMSGARKNGSIVMYDAGGKPVARWNFTNGWPSKWGRVSRIDSFTLKQRVRSPAVEELTLHYEHISRAGYIASTTCHMAAFVRFVATDDRTTRRRRPTRLVPRPMAEDA